MPATAEIALASWHDPARQSREELAVPDFPRHRAHVAVLHLPVRVDEERLWRAVDAEVDRRSAFGIHRHDVVGIAELAQPAVGGGVLVLPVESDEDHAPPA